MKKVFVIFTALLFLSACGSDTSEKDHILQHQEDALKKAGEVEGMLQEAEKKRSESVRERDKD